jgi:diacylglycerol kinase (ATP)
VKDAFLAVVNPAAGGGRCRKLVGPALDKLQAAGIRIEVAETTAPGQGIDITSEAYVSGYRNFIAVGGDGTSYEIVNGIYKQFKGATPSKEERPTLGFLPLGTGNSFLRDFSEQGVDAALNALLAGRRQPCDVLRLKHKQGVIYYINLLSVGFTADVATMRARRFRGYGQLGYVMAIFTCLAQLKRRPFPLRLEGNGTVDSRKCLFLTFNNSKFTGGTMMIAPKAEVNDGLIEYVRWGPIGRLGLIRNLPTLYDGTHIQHPLASHQAVRRVDFELEGAVDVMVDGEVLTLHCETLDVLPSALNVVV